MQTIKFKMERDVLHNFVLKDMENKIDLEPTGSHKTVQSSQSRIRTSESTRNQHWPGSHERP